MSTRDFMYMIFSAFFSVVFSVVLGCITALILSDFNIVSSSKAEQYGIGFFVGGLYVFFKYLKNITGFKFANEK